MADVSLDDIQLALVPVSKKSASVYKSVVILCKSIFRAAKESHVIDEDPTNWHAKGEEFPRKKDRHRRMNRLSGFWTRSGICRPMYL